MKLTHSTMKSPFSLPATILLFCMLYLTNCTSNKKDNANAANDQPVDVSSSGPQFQVEKNFQNQLSSFYAAYLNLKDAFVSSDTAKVRSAAAESSEQLTKIDMNQLTGAAHHDWMAFLPNLQNALKNILQTKDMEQQRMAFSLLSDNLYKSIKAFGLGSNKEAFYEYCPMAFNNEGAHWLSDQENIRNPYFGDQMLTCGQVQEVIKF